MRVVVVAGGVLGVALGVPVGGDPDEREDRDGAAGNTRDAPDRVGQGSGEWQPGYFRSTTIVFTEAVTPSATSTTTT